MKSSGAHQLTRLRGLLLLACPRKKGCCGTAWQRICGVSCFRQPEITTTMTKLFTLLAVALLAMAEASATSPDSMRCIKKRLTTTPAARGISPTDPARPPEPPPATRHEARRHGMTTHGWPRSTDSSLTPPLTLTTPTVPTVRPSPPPRTTDRQLLSLGADQKISNASLTPQLLSLLQDHQNEEVGSR